jgi:hypothetical protein
VRTLVLLPFPLIAGTAQAGDSFTIQRPGELPTHVYSRPGGGYTVIDPDRLQTYIDRTINGYRVNRPGELPAYIYRPHSDPDGED